MKIRKVTFSTPFGEKTEKIRVLSHNESMPPGYWREFGIVRGDCGYGCKVYRRFDTGSLIVCHNSSYGCSA